MKPAYGTIRVGLAGARFFAEYVLPLAPAYRSHPLQ
jgi:hypothetical protein